MVADRDHYQYRKRSSAPAGLHSHDWDERRSYQDCFEKADWVGFEFSPAGDADRLFGRFVHDLGRHNIGRPRRTS